MNRRNRVVKNASYLSVAQISGYIVPLLEMPILAKALGPENYGKILLVQNIGLLFSLIVEYGFNLSATREVAIIKNDSKKISQLFSDVLAAKIILALIIAFIFILLSFFVPQIDVHIDFNYFIWGFLYFFAFAFSPFWFFLGREKVGKVIIIELTLRMVCLLLLCLLVKGPDDAVLALILMSSVSFLNTLVSTCLCLRQICFVWPILDNAIEKIRSGFHLFIYRSSNTMLVSAAPSLIGALSGRTAVGIFVPAEKLVRAVVGLSTPIFNAAYPYFSSVASRQDSPSSSNAAWYMTVIAAFIAIIVAVAMYFFGPNVLLLLVGREFVESALLLKWFVWLIPLRVTNQAIGLLVLIPAGKDRQTSYSFIFFSLFSILIGALLINDYGALGMVKAMLLAEFGLLIVLTFIGIQRNKRR